VEEYGDGLGGLASFGEAVAVGGEDDAVGVDIFEYEFVFDFFGASLREVEAEGVVGIVDVGYDFGGGLRVGLEEVCEAVNVDI